MKSIQFLIIQYQILRSKNGSKLAAHEIDGRDVLRLKGTAVSILAVKKIFFKFRGQKKNGGKLTGNSITVILAHEIDGRVNHSECDVQTGFIFRLETATRGFEKVFQTWPSLIHRGPKTRRYEK